MTDVQYRAKIRLTNRRGLKKHLKALVKKHGKGYVPLEEAFRFDFKWECIPLPSNSGFFKILFGFFKF